MRKLLLIFSLFLLSFQCEPRLEEYDSGSWYIRNSTESNIFVKSGDADDFYSILAPEEVVFIHRMQFAPEDEIMKFDFLYLVNPREDYIEIATEDKVVVKTWRESEKNDVGRQLFDEQYWRLRKFSLGKRGIYFQWTFDILPEDIGVVN